MKKKFSKLFSVMLVFAMVLGMNLNVSAATNTTIAVPTKATEQATPSTIKSVEVLAGDEDVVASFYKDDNTSDQMYIRAMFPATTAVADLQEAIVVVELNDEKVSFNASGLEFDSTGVCESADLLNKAYTLTIDGTDYILAAGITGGSQDIPNTEPNALKSVTVGNVAGNLTRNVVQSDFMGNLYFSADPDNVLEWTSVNYYVAANMGVARPDSLTAAYTKADGTTGSAALDMTKSAPSIKVDGKTYYFKLTFTGDITVKYSIDFQEFENTRTASNASSFASEAEWAAAVAQKNAIVKAWAEYFGNDGQAGDALGNTVVGTITVPSGTTVMSQIVKFLNAEFPGVDTNNSDTYIASINGLGEFTIGSMSGWMYLEGEWTPTCSVPMVGAADYQMTTDGATITWFYVTDYMNHF